MFSGGLQTPFLCWLITLKSVQSSKVLLYVLVNEIKFEGLLFSHWNWVLTNSTEATGVTMLKKRMDDPLTHNISLF